MLISQVMFRLLGSMWVFAGVAMVLVSVLSAIIQASVLSFFEGRASLVTAILRPILERSGVPGQQVLAVPFALFCIVFGFSLSRLRPWARTAGVAFNIAMGLCMIAIAYLFYTQLSAPGLVSSALPGETSVIVLVIGVFFGCLLVAGGIALSHPKSMDLFFEPASNVLDKAEPAICPTCAGPLDLNLQRCPICDAENMTSPKRAKLVDKTNVREYAVFVLKDQETTIGRDVEGLDISLDDRTVSGRHARIEYDDKSFRFYLHAEDDVNGTYVNDEKTRESEIHNGDVLGFGDAKFEFVVST